MNAVGRMTLRYEPFSPEVRDDPFPYYAELRAHAPVYWAEEAQAWCVSRYADARDVLRDPTRLSSDAMRSMLTGAKPGPDPLADPNATQRLLAVMQALPFPLEELPGARNLISEDPPRHGALRSLVNRGFTPRRIAAWEPLMREVVDGCMQKLRDADEFDVVADLAVPLPVRVIAEMLGVELERRDDFKHWSNKVIVGSTGSARLADPIASGYAGAMRGLCEYVQGVAAVRRRAPSDDLISVLLSAQDGEVGLTDAELAFFVLLLLVAGNETTTNLIGNATRALLHHPEQLARVHADPGLVPALVEETLRWDGPAQSVFRRSTCDIELAGGHIPANSHVMVLIGSANRDERYWGPTAEDFDVTRDTSGHIAFGLGNHFCLGAALARLEARVALEALVEELPRLETDGAPVEYIDSFVVRGPRRLALRRTAR